LLGSTAGESENVERQHNIFLAAILVESYFFQIASIEILQLEIGGGVADFQRGRRCGWFGVGGVQRGAETSGEQTCHQRSLRKFVHSAHSFDQLLSQQKNNDATLSLLSDEGISTFPFGDRVQSARFSDGFSFAPSGLDFVGSCTHGLRRGLHSYAAPRLIYCGCDNNCGLDSCAASRLVYRGFDNNRGLRFSDASRLTAGFVLRRLGIGWRAAHEPTDT